MQERNGAFAKDCPPAHFSAEGEGILYQVPAFDVLNDFTDF
jgi:hypothetical protein